MSPCWRKRRARAPSAVSRRGGGREPGTKCRDGQKEPGRMISVSQVGGISTERNLSRRTQAGFRLPPSSDALPATAASAPAALDGMLALQEGEADAARDRGARRHSQSLLRELAALQRALLSGVGDPACLQRLAALGRAVPDAADPASPPSSGAWPCGQRSRSPGAGYDNLKSNRRNRLTAHNASWRPRYARL